MPRRILHLSADPLPDPRVEKAAVSAKKAGCDVHFAGPRSKPTCNVFSNIHELHFDRWGKLFPDMEAVSKVLQEVGPDLVHAHNIIAARLCRSQGLPYVYDDHELWSLSMRVKTFSAKRSWRTPLSKAHRWFATRQWTLWEEEIDAPVVTVSEPIAQFHRNAGRKAWVLPNMPSRTELPHKLAPKPRGALVSAYVGADNMTSGWAGRDMRGFYDLFRDGAHGKLLLFSTAALEIKEPCIEAWRVAPKEVISELMNADLGLIPWKPHPFHVYCNPNKVYEYAHAGLHVVMPETLDPPKHELSEWQQFADYAELGQFLKEWAPHPGDLRVGRESRVLYAREHFVWERFEHRLFEAYDKAISGS